MTSKTLSTLSLSVYDYIIFITTLAFSAAIGIYYGCFGTKQASTKEYLLGSKKTNILPIAISVAISHISGIWLEGTVSDVYRYGSAIWCFVSGIIVMGLLSCFIYLPVFFKLQTPNVYEYLERRFDRKTRILAAILYFLNEIMSFPVTAYPPSLIFSTVSGINPSLAAFILCSICVFYTSVGGLSTVIWTDFLQCGIMIASLLIIYAIGLNTSGGFSSVWNKALDGQRLQVFNFNVDFTARDTFWAYIASSQIVTAGIAVHPTGVQKFLTLKKYIDWVWSVLHTVILMCLVHTFCVFIGLVVYSKYKDCDPLAGHMISKHDQIFAYFVAETGGNLPGVSGLFLAGICSASLSTISSSLNALSGVVYEDVVCRFLKKRPSEKRGSDILKIIVLVAGLLGTCLVFAIERMGEIISISSFIWGLTQGPLLGIFTLGILFSRANHKGAFYGGVGGFIFVACLSVPNKYYEMKGLITYPTKPLSTIGCDLLSASTSWNTTTLIDQTPFQPYNIFKINFYYFVAIGTISTIIIGLCISFLTKSGSIVDKDLLSPIIYSCLSKQRQDNEERVGYNDLEEASNILNRRV